jgi:hypothetical protein
MSVLLACLPYVASISLYWMACRDLFYGTQGDVPAGWQLRVAAPVIMAGFTPLVIASKKNEAVGLLSCATGFVLLCVVLFYGVTRRGNSAFFHMRRPVAIAGWRLPWLKLWVLTFVTGVAVIVFSAAVTIFVG